MIGIISSTIYPSDSSIYGGARSLFSSQERLAQTQGTVESLLNAGISPVFLFDNSGDLWVDGTESLLSRATTYVFNSHQYNNKGISELYLLLESIKYLPVDTPILKISGRYALNGVGRFELDGADLLVKIYDHGFRRKSMSTRCYAVRNKEVLETFIRRTLREIYGFHSRVVGPASLLRVIKKSILPHLDNYPYDDPSYSIESISALVLKMYPYRVKQIDILGVEGLAGAFKDTKIVE